MEKHHLWPCFAFDIMLLRALNHILYLVVFFFFFFFFPIYANNSLFSKEGEENFFF